MPEVNLPNYRGGYPEDAAVHVRRAIENHIRHFGERPRGMWPSEGSVCQAIIPLLAEQGSSGSRPMKKFWDVRRTARSAATAGAMSAIPSCSIAPGRCASPTTSWRSSFATIRCPTRSVSLSAEPRAGRGRRLHGQAGRDRRRLPAKPGDPRPGHSGWRELLGVLPGRRRVVPSFALPGGRPRPLRIRPVKIGEFLNEHPPADTLAPPVRGKLDQPQFRDLGRPSRRQSRRGTPCTRRDHSCSTEERSLRHDAAILEKRGTRSTSPQGSDWFWWYGDDHSSALDGLFDHLFRKHLRNVYALLGCDPPGSLYMRSLERAGQQPLHEAAHQFLAREGRRPRHLFRVDRRAHHACGNERGTMTQVADGLMDRVWFGFDAERLLIRVDTQGGPRGSFWPRPTVCGLALSSRRSVRSWCAARPAATRSAS